MILLKLGMFNMTGFKKLFLIVISNICKRHKRVLAWVTPALGQSVAVERTTKGHGLDVATLKICFIKRTSLNFLFLCAKAKFRQLNLMSNISWISIYRRFPYFNTKGQQCTNGRRLNALEKKTYQTKIW